MKINIDMEAWELATVIKGLTISPQPEEKKPILSDKTREELKKAIANAIANAFKVPEKVTVLPQKTESKKSGYVSKDNPNPNYRPPMGGKTT